MSLQPHANAFTPAEERRYKHHLLVRNEPVGTILARRAWQPHPSPAFGFILAAPLGACVWLVIWTLVS
jgi:hypothetical protein